MTQDRRIHTRVKTHVPARIHRGTEHVEGVIENLGEGGVFFATEVLEMSLDEGAAVDVAFTLDRNGVPEPIRVSGTVLRTERYFDGESVVRAFAIRFDQLLDLTGLTVA